MVRKFEYAPHYTVFVDDISGAVEVTSSHPNTKGNILKQRKNNSGYMCCKMNHRNITLHSLVAKYFIGDRPDGMVINHKDGDKLNNKPYNLEYCTIADNIKHAIEHGLHVSCDPTRMPTYKDGRTKDRKKYQSEWYQKNRDKVLERVKKRYYEQKE